MIDIGINDEHNLPYGVLISKILGLNQVVLLGETKVICNRTNEIGKAILTCIGLKKTANSWVFRDFKRTFEKAGKLKKFVLRMEKKMDEIIKNYVESSSSTEELDEDYESSDEDSMVESESE
ncbi:hypothetical protein V8G54_000860 [Vigna mungo]|uniref:Uncharacterized protein n=1 Tax=Vigna mungo TaxID=3915 RepID=A0AAQ3P5C0_VIGMU